MKSKKIQLPWKQKNFRKIPTAILARAKSFLKDEIVVACVKRIPKSAIASGKYHHLGITLENDNLIFPTNLIPDVRVGTYSRTNVEGKEIVRKDLPKTLKTVYIETPNYGDWTKGSHTVGQRREVYKRDIIYPKELELKIELLSEELKSEKFFTFRFTVDILLNRKGKDFKEDLLYSLNLLQENVGASNVFPNQADLAVYLKTINVSWEILPPGDRESVVMSILSRLKAPSKEIRNKLVQRYNLLSRLKPIAFISGSNGFRRYFGAQFSDKLIIFENLEYGNAIYAMFEDWETLSKLSRLELLSGKREGFMRIVHKSGWEIELKKLVKAKA